MSADTNVLISITIRRSATEGSTTGDYPPPVQRYIVYTGPASNLRSKPVSRLLLGELDAYPMTPSRSAATADD